MEVEITDKEGWTTVGKNTGRKKGRNSNNYLLPSKQIRVEEQYKFDDVNMENVPIKSGSQLDDNEVDEYSHFESESKEDVEETQFQKVQASLSENDVDVIVKIFMEVDPGTDLNLTQEHNRIVEVNNLSPGGLERGKTGWTNLRKDLWTDLLNPSNTLTCLWAMMGDFNVITTPGGKIAGNSYRIDKSFDFLETIVTHLANVCSDHVPLLIQFSSIEEVNVRYFKLLNFWTDHEDFSYVVKSIWEEDIQGNPPWSLHQKLKKAASKLSSWSREVYGDIHEEPIRLEREISNLEIVLMNDSSKSNRTKLYKSKAEYIRYLKIQDSKLRQKARVKWLSEGDSNTSYCHSVIKDKRRELGIKKIQNEHFQWVEGTKEVYEAALRYFQGNFSQKPEYNDYSELNIIDPVISEDINKKLIAFPIEEELKICVFSMDSDSSPGPNGFTAKFFQSCWSIVAPDIIQSFKSIFCGHNIPNQSGFVKVKSISENILLAQEIIQDIRKPNEEENIALKLDMAKAYDRMA
ncbi:uncharacterized protein [Nicotiana tomentosiformis]|uniref:uncharacterized protein n=1 Tax=Nicotiana tomentosiformis TaxID=4098 RepID=UPI00388C8F63